MLRTGSARVVRWLRVFSLRSTANPTSVSTTDYAVCFFSFERNSLRSFATFGLIITRQ
jgi:hypothetical protein